VLPRSQFSIKSISQEINIWQLIIGTNIYDIKILIGEHSRDMKYLFVEKKYSYKTPIIRLSFFLLRDPLSYDNRSNPLSQHLRVSLVTKKKKYSRVGRSEDLIFAFVLIAYFAWFFFIFIDFSNYQSNQIKFLWFFVGVVLGIWRASLQNERQHYWR
jgi:hypothetical protein